MEYFFNRVQKKTKKACNFFPKQGKNRAQQPSQCGLPGNGPQKQRQGTADPALPMADAEGHIHPAKERRHNKNSVRQSGQPGPQGPEKAVNDTKPRPKGEGLQPVDGGNVRRSHPNRRRHPPAGRGSS